MYVDLWVFPNCGNTVESDIETIIESLLNKLHSARTCSTFRKCKSLWQSVCDSHFSGYLQCNTLSFSTGYGCAMKYALVAQICETCSQICSNSNFLLFFGNSNCGLCSLYLQEFEKLQLGRWNSGLKWPASPQRPVRLRFTIACHLECEVKTCAQMWQNEVATVLKKSV